jgi:ribosomal protein S18 acetylase RimI-like enzyme
MPNLTHSPDFTIRTITPAEWQENATGNLALPPGFWEGPGANLTEARVTPLGAFLGERMLGYIGVREVASSVLTEITKTALQQLIVRRRVAGDISETSVAAIERPAIADDEVVTYNLAFALVGERGQGVGTALTDAALEYAAQNASPEQPTLAHLSVARTNPAVRLYTREGFEPLSVDGQAFVREYPYSLPPSAEGIFEPPVTVPHILMGTVLEGSAAGR